jgi:hypothetical protein
VRRPGGRTACFLPFKRGGFQAGTRRSVKA